MGTLLFIAIALLALWVIGRLFFKSLGCIIHIALILAVLLVIFWLLRSVFHLF